MFDLRSVFDPVRLLGVLIVITICLPVHEYAHAKMADLAGDYTPRMQGRVSLNPMDHLDPIGTVLIFLFGFGWGKPVPVNPMNFRNPRRDMVLVSLWGPLANIITAFAFGILTRYLISIRVSPSLIQVSYFVVLINLLIGFFNLIPVPPLDGSKILSGLLPTTQAYAFDTFAARYWIFLLIGALFLGLYIIFPLAHSFARLFAGM